VENCAYIAHVLKLAPTKLSCSSTKNIKYFQDLPDSGAVVTVKQAEYSEPKIQVDDIVTIIVQTLDPVSTEAIYRGNVVAPSAGVSSNQSAVMAGQQPIGGYLVDKKGEVELAYIGKVHLGGLTTTEAKEKIRAATEVFFKQPNVIVRYANFKVTVAGEVARPATIILPNEKVTVLDALTMAGDLTIYGKRENILLLRDNLDGTKTAYRINLNKSSIINQSYYYLHQNDYIYVEPTKGKAAANDLSQTKTIAIIGSTLSLLIVIASRLL
jgi:polysaccharide export outer membrane protein